jgi:hypothetical protein
MYPSWEHYDHCMTCDAEAGAPCAGRVLANGSLEMLELPHRWRPYAR